MKRSEINDILREGEAFIRSFGHFLPPFADWPPDRMRGPDGALIRERRLGWDITDYGQGRFDTLGLFLFTIRNGSLGALSQGRGMVYAEKIMISRRDQLSPMHRHILKTEDIINRGGGDLVLKLHAARPDGAIDPDAAVEVLSDGVPQTMTAGGHLRLRPGSSVTLPPTVWHAFWAEGGDCLIAEVSTVNDDLTDNVFADPIGRFSNVTEDVAPLRLLVSDYD
ncbi:ATP synthase delta chain [Rhodovulum sp. P5]|uniref:D-lyxose/D-mannose family sugar isomerase n=1 Tax=Rhodovulum sp. P5 TaxID=1564506 RepID=UPI0009C26558|nr:D-lyxose/D-mannose family sugar isomerase [Rhodovulum sp. P5]ARE40813.1 ATP synthase delta chain [Rhodovulum sp. P5]